MKKSQRLGLVLTPAEKEAVALLAKSRRGLSRSALVRCLIHDVARAANFPVEILSHQDKKSYEKT